jgi:quercetin 2,3-dioxygenase
MKQIIFPSNKRGHAQHGWLDTYHSFSFASYYNPEMVHFGALRVLNDDIVQGGEGFGTHPHDNMEIITIPLTGALEHRDNTGRQAIIKSGDVQMMSAGKGIAHSEYNASKTEPVNLLQIWIFPKKKDIEPLYQQITYKESDFSDTIKTVVSPTKQDNTLLINQDAWLSLGRLKQGGNYSYKIKKEGNGLYAFLIEGSINIDGNELGRRDAVGIYEANEVNINSKTDSYLLIMDLPLKF